MSSIAYLVDDRDPDVKYLCSTTHVSEDHHANFYEDTSSTVANGTDCSDGWFQYTFNGTAVDIPVSYSQPTTNYSLTLDGNEVVANHSSLTDLSDEEHTIVYATAANVSLSPTFDFLSVVAGSRTKMKGRNVIVDDGDSAITYSGDGWRSSVMEPFTFPDGRGVYKDTLHFTRQVGDTLSFEFAGSSLYIYAMLPFSQNGSVSVKECVEGPEVGAICTTFGNLFNNHTDSSGVELIGGMGGFPAGVNKATLSIDKVRDAYSIGFDFVTYEATFDSIDAIPTVRKSNKHVGAIVGGVIGGLAFIALVIFAFVWWRRRGQPKGSRFSFTKKKSLAFGGTGAPTDSAEMEK
ncbi:hypothetical protein CPB85DRAFT_1565685 [Mucidula mucida]|nr:hypothetical protein CPB85DRAFT_1565685 [Mucidula mucida]